MCGFRAPPIYWKITLQLHKSSFSGVNFPKITLHVFIWDSEKYMEKLFGSYFPGKMQFSYMKWCFRNEFLSSTRLECTPRLFWDYFQDFRQIMPFVGDFVWNSLFWVILAYVSAISPSLEKSSFKMSYPRGPSRTKNTTESEFWYGSNLGTDVVTRYRGGSPMLFFLRKRGRKTVQKVKTTEVAKHYGFERRTIFSTTYWLIVYCRLLS